MKLLGSKNGHVSIVRVVDLDLGQKYTKNIDANLATITD
jgi:hypothetical protein